MAVSWYIVAALFATALGASVTPQNLILEKSTCGRVWLTVHSPEINQGNGVQLLDALELNWDFRGCSSIPRQIGLFRDRPTSWSNALHTFLVYSEAGHEITSTSLGDEILPAGWESGGGLKGPHCLWPWIGAGDNNIQAYNCLKIQPTWMEDHAEKINDLRIGSLVIAGAHNAGAWRFDTQLNQAARDNLVLCQDRSIWNQLVHGIRYLDFRVAYYQADDEEDRYWLNHNLIPVRRLTPLLKEIRNFLDSTKEVVFLDFHHFPIGFYESNNSPIYDVHAGLLRIVQRELGPHLAHASDFHTGIGSRGPTLKALIDANKRFVFSYVDNTIVSQNNWLWPNLPHLWANTNNPLHLFEYLDRVIKEHPLGSARSPLHSAMAQTTPSVVDILFGRTNLRRNADTVNRNVTERLYSMWRNNANIIATDFFLANDVIDLSIAISVERSGRL